MTQAPANPQEPAEPRLPEPGEWIGDRFQIIRRIGRGGFGMVYEARQKSMGHRRVALKVLAPRKAHEPNAAERFRQEALLASRLHHPNTITLFDFGETDEGLFYIAMEYLEGEPLGEVLRHGPLPPARAEHIARQILASLAEAHTLGLIHRDLKPDNIFLCRIFGETDLVKVLDFGLAKLAGALDEAPLVGEPMPWRTDLTLDGLVCGTPDYMAPEQARGRSPLTPACDVYAVGLLIFHMLTGRKPYSGPAPVEVLKKQVSDPMPPLPAPLASLRLARVMSFATRKAADQRYPDASAMLLALTAQGPVEPHEVATGTTHADFSVDLGQPEDPTLCADLHADHPTSQEPRSSQEDARQTTSAAQALPRDEPSQDTSPHLPSVAHEPWPATTHTTPALPPSPLHPAPPLIGRHDELGKVLGALRASLDERHGRVLLLRGAEGVGKSRLADEIARIVRETSDALVLKGRLRDPEAPTHEALSTLLAQLFGIKREALGDQPSLVERLRALAQHHRLDIEERDLALLAQLVGAAPSDPQDNARPALLLARLARLLLDASRQTPILLLLEDLHLADATTLELLRRLSSALARDPQEPHAHGLCLLLTMRPEDPTRRAEILRLLQALERAPQDTFLVVNISPLKEADAHKLVDAILPSSPELRRRVAEAAYHTPRHIQHLLQHLHEDHQLYRDPDGLWHLEEPERPLALPRDLRAVLRLRVADLVAASSAPEAMQDLLHRLAVLGLRVPQGLLRTFLELEQRPWPPRLLRRLLREAEHSGLLHLEEDPLGEATPHIAFEDGMLPEVLAHEVAATAVGPRLHRNAARAKRAFWRDEADQHAQEIAEHLLRAGQAADALPLLLSAAQTCQRAGDLSLANQRYHRLEKLLPAHAPPAKLAHELWLGMGEVHLRLGHHGPALAYLSRLLHEQHASPKLKARGHLRLGELRLIQRQYDDARDHLAHAHRLAAQEGEAEVALEAVLLQGHPETEDPPTLAELSELQRQIEALTDHAPHLKARGLCHLGRCWLERGDAIAAERYLGRARLIVDEIGDPALQAPVLAELGRALLQQARLAEGEGLLREARALSREQGDRPTLARTLCALALAARLREATDDALALLEQALHLQQTLGLARDAAESLSALGRLHETQGDLSSAHHRYSAALQTPDLPADLDAELHLRLGTTALKRGQLDPARFALDAAARLFADLGYAPMQVQALNLLAMEASWRGDAPHALALLRRSEALAARCADHAGHLFALLGLALLSHLTHPRADEPKALLEQAQALQRRAVPAMLPLLATVERALQGLPPQESISTELPDLQRAWLEKVLTAH